MQQEKWHIKKKRVSKNPHCCRYKNKRNTRLEVTDKKSHVEKLCQS
jgi:hypothetical protein